MRIIHSLAPARYGGLERVVQSLSRAESLSGHDVHVAVVLDAGAETEHPFPALVGRDGVDVHVLSVPLRGYRLERRLMDDLYHRLAPDVVHTHGYRADVLHGGIASRVGAAHVTTVHGFTGGGIRNRLYEALQRRSYRRCQAVVAVSRPIAKALSAHGIARTCWIPNAWDGRGAALVDRQTARARFNAPDGVFHVGFVGRVDRVKGADIFLDALAHVSDLPFVASVVGTSPEVGRMIARAATLGVADRIRWHGLVPEAGRWFRGFDVFVLSSRTEGTPMALLEAMAARVPVVSTRVGGVPDVVSEVEAQLVESERADLLAAAIRRVYDDPEAARERAARARARLDRELSVAAWVSRYNEVYADAVSCQRRRRS